MTRAIRSRSLVRRRIFAHFADLFVIYASQTLGALLGAMLSKALLSPEAAANDAQKYIIGGTMLGWVFWGWTGWILNSVVLQGWTGQSIGKRLAGIKTIEAVQTPAHVIALPRPVTPATEILESSSTLDQAA